MSCMNKRLTVSTTTLYLTQRQDSKMASSVMHIQLANEDYVQVSNDGESNVSNGTMNSNVTSKTNCKTVGTTDLVRNEIYCTLRLQSKLLVIKIYNQ